MKLSEVSFFLESEANTGRPGLETAERGTGSERTANVNECAAMACGPWMVHGMDGRHVTRAPWHVELEGALQVGRVSPAIAS